MAEYVAKVKGMMTGDIQQKSLLTQADEAMTLSWRNRFIGFGVGLFPLLGCVAL